MKRKLTILLLTLFVSCKESFESIQPEEFNREISNRADIKTPDDLVKLFYAYPETETEPEPQLIITSKKLKEDLFEVQLIHHHVPDDALGAYKIILTARRIGHKWNVLKIERNWKCRKFRGGQTDWGIKACP